MTRSMVTLVHADKFFHPDEIAKLFGMVNMLNYQPTEYGSEVTGFNFLFPGVENLFETALGESVVLDVNTSGLFRKPMFGIHFEGFTNIDEWCFIVALEPTTFNVFHHISGAESAIQGYQFNYRNPFEWGDAVANIELKRNQGLFFRPWLFHSLDKGVVQYYKLKPRYNGNEIGPLWAWRYDDYGQLGDGTFINRKEPVRVSTTDSNWLKIDGTISGSFMAIKDNGTLWGWGNNTFGQLGNGTTDNKNTPEQVFGNNWCGLSVGSRHAAGLKNDNTLWLWGNNTYAQLAQSDFEDRLIPTQITGNDWVDVACGTNITVAIKFDTTIFGWGKIDKSIPDADLITCPMSICDDKGWVKVVINSNNTIVGLKNDGTVWIWNDSDYRKPEQMDTDSDWVKVDITNNYFAGIKTDGSLWVGDIECNDDLIKIMDGDVWIYLSPVSSITDKFNCIHKDGYIYEISPSYETMVIKLTDLGDGWGQVIGNGTSSLGIKKQTS